MGARQRLVARGPGSQPVRPQLPDGRVLCAGRPAFRPDGSISDTGEVILRPAAAAPGYTTVSLAAALDVTRRSPCSAASTVSSIGAIRTRSAFCSRPSECLRGSGRSYSAGERVALRPVLSGRGPTLAQYVKCPGHHCLRWERAIAGDRVIY